MSTIILPSRSLLKPDRSILVPGWDDRPVDRPRRAGRSAWWRRLLSGRAGLTRLQPGACCGCSHPNCGSCTIPAPLFLTDSFTTIALTGGGGISTGCYLLPVTSSCTPCDCYNALPPSGGGSMLITYVVDFFGSVGGTGCSLSVSRGWTACTSGGVYHYCIDQYTGCNFTTQTCTLLSPPNPVPGTTTTKCRDSNIGGGAGFTDSYSGVLTSCAFPMSITLTLATVGTLTSPLSSGVTISS
jgi:hypothetical protein